MRRTTVVGVGAVVLYLIALMFSAALRHDDTRPLYDGFTPPPSYRFVDPPPFFSADNVEPQPMTTKIALDGRGSRPAGFATPDGQFAVSLARGAITRASGATSVAVRVTPLAPSTLPPVPNGLRANGNAYRVDMTYEPTGAPVTRFAKPGTLLLEIPEVGISLFDSPGGAGWTKSRARAVSTSRLSLSAPFAAPGYYLAATNLPELAPQPGRSHHTAVVLGVVVSVVAVALFVAAYVLARKRHRMQ